MAETLAAVWAEEAAGNFRLPCLHHPWREGTSSSQGWDLLHQEPGLPSSSQASCIPWSQAQE